MATFRKIYFDGCNGWVCGELVEAEPCPDGKIVLEDEDGFRLSFGSRNGDGLYENEEGQTLLVPVAD